MSYEIEAMPTNTPVVNQQPQTMKEDKVIDMYASSNRAAKIGQKSIVEGNDPVESKDTTTESVTLSPQVAALARKEQKFRQQEQQLKKRELEVEAKLAKAQKYEQLEAKLAAKDYSALEDVANYEDYTNYLLNKGKDETPEQAEIKRLSAEMQAFKKAQENDVSKRFEAAVNERRKAVTSLVESNPDYSSIKELNAQEAVVQHILDTWEQDEIDLSPEQAAQEVEELLVERAAKMAALTKLKSKTVESEDKKALPPLKSGIKTLTNNMAATGETKPLRSLSSYPESERYAEAMRRAQEKLNKQRG